MEQTVENLSEGARTEAPALEGRLNRPMIPLRRAGLEDISLTDLGGELWARINEGAFTADEGRIVLGSQIQDALQRALDVHNNRLSKRRYRDQFGAFYGWIEPPRPVLQQMTIVELGCGSINPFGLLFLFLMIGAR